MPTGFFSAKSGALLLTAASVAFSGCGFAMIDSTPAAYAPLTEPSPSFGHYSIGVLQVEDARPSERGGNMMLCDFLSPFVPTSSGYTDRPDEKPVMGPPTVGPLPNMIWEDLVAQMRHDHVVDLAYPVVAQAGDYPPVNFHHVMAPTAYAGVQVHSVVPVTISSKQRPQLVLKTTLTQSRWDSKLFCFLPIVGALLFPVFGVPFEKDTYNLGMKLELFNRSDMKTPLWNFTVNETSVGYTNPYWYVTGPDQDESAERAPQIVHDLVAAGLQKAAPDLTAYLTSQPNTFWHDLPSATSADAGNSPNADQTEAPPAQPASEKPSEDEATLQKLLEQIPNPAH